MVRGQGFKHQRSGVQITEVSGQRSRFIHLRSVVRGQGSYTRGQGLKQQRSVVRGQGFKHKRSGVQTPEVRGQKPGVHTPDVRGSNNRGQWSEVRGSNTIG